MIQYTGGPGSRRPTRNPLQQLSLILHHWIHLSLPPIVCNSTHIMYTISIPPCLLGNNQHKNKAHYFSHISFHFTHMYLKLISTTWSLIGPLPDPSFFSQILCFWWVEGRRLSTSSGGFTLGSLLYLGSFSSLWHKWFPPPGLLQHSLPELHISR